MKSKMLSRPTLVPALTGYLLGVLSVALVAGIVFAVNRYLGGEEFTIHQSFDSAPDGTASTADSGQQWLNTANNNPGAGLTVRDGRLTNTAVEPRPAAGYLSAKLDRSVTKIQVSFEFAPGTTENGSAAVLVRTEMPPEHSPGRSTLTSPCHLVITRSKLDFGVANNGVITVLGTQRFAEELEYDRNYTATIELDYRSGVARVEGPDGGTYVYLDPRITSNRGSAVSFEVYQQTASTDDRARFSFVGAS